MEWAGLELLLKLSRGTLTDVAASEGVDETTISRRLKAMERRAGATLLERQGRRLRPTAAAVPLVEIAEKMEQSLLSAHQASAVRPLVRVATVPSFVDYVLAPRLGRLLTQAPHLLVQLDGANETLSLAQRQADISLRLGRPAEGKLKIRKLGDMQFCLVSASERADQRLLAYGQGLDDLPEMRAGFAATAPDPALRLSSFAALIAASRQGLGCIMLPLQLIPPDFRVVTPEVSVTREIWLVVHEDLHDRPEVRLVRDWIAEAVTQALAEPWASSL